MDTSTDAAPTWLDNLVDVLVARRRTWLSAAVAIVLAGALLALLAPGLLPPTWLVGLAVGVAAVLLATALVIALDAADLVVRGPRHVVAAGGVVSGTISRSPADIDALVRLIDAHSPGSGVRVALTPASRSAGVPGARANMIAEALADRGHKVLCTDLTRGGTPAAGLSEVLANERKLADVVRFDEELYLAHLTTGTEPERALEGFADWATSLPSDLDVLVAALPPLAEPGVLPAVQGVELVLVLVEVDRTERVDLIACLDAIDASGVPAELVLVDATLDTSVRPHSPAVEVVDRSGERPPHDDFALPEATDGDRVATGPERDGDGDDASAGPEGAGSGAAAAAGVTAAAGIPGADADEASHTDEPDDHPTGRRGGLAGRFARSRRGNETEAMPAVDDEGVRIVESRRDPAEGQDTAEDRETTASPDAWDEDDEGPPVAAPGSGHVRTVHGPARRPPSSPATTAGRSGMPGSSPRADDTAPPAATRPPAEPLVRDTLDDDEDDEDDVDVPARPPPSASAEPEAGDSTPGDDDIDMVARETARLTASLQQLANEVWQRDDE